MATIRLYNDGEHKVKLKSVDTEVVYQDYKYNFIPSGTTQIEQSGNTVTIYTPTLDDSGLVTETKFNTYTGDTKTRIDNLESTVTDVNNDIDDKLDITDFESYTGDTDTRITTIETDVDDLESDKLDISEFNTYTGDTDTRITTIESDIDDLETDKLDESLFNTYTGDTQTTISGIENDISSIESDVEDRVTITDFNTYTGDTETTISSIESDISGLQTSVNDKLDITDFESYTGDTDTKINSIEDDISSIHDDYVPKSGGTFEGVLNGTTLNLSGDLNIDGDINYVYTQTINSESDFINMREGNTSAISAGEISGINIQNSNGDGLDALFGSDNEGILRIGWSGDTLQAVATREDAPISDGIAYWDSATDKFITDGLTMTEVINHISDTNNSISNLESDKLDITDFNDYTGTTDTRITTIETDVSNLESDKLNVTDFNDYSGSTDTRITTIETDVSNLETDKLNVSTFDTYTGDTQTTISGIQSDITDLEDNKADSSSLSQVATTGDYDDLSNKPTLGSMSTKNYWEGTQSEYDALGSYDSDTLYFIND